jgi:23S rRNA (uracil1939-C5)-methyltransferase
VRKKKAPVFLDNIPIEDYAAEGKSLARVDGKVIFIDQVVPGDIVNLRITRDKKDWAEGKLEKLVSLSPDRTEPFCPHFGICGGCQWQMLPYEKQLQYKQKQVEETLKRIGKMSLPSLQNIAGAEQTRYYRNKLEYTFGNRRFLLREELNDPAISSEQPVAGYHAKGMFDKLVDIQTCFLQEEPTNELRIAVKNLALREGWPFYDIRNHTGFLRNMQVRICTTGEIMVNVVLGENRKEWIDLLMKQLAERFPQVTTFLYTVNEKWNDSIINLAPVIYKGDGYITEKLEDFSFKIGPTSFFQTNTRQAEVLYKVTREFANLSGKEVLYDLYCGTGSIGIFLSKNASKVIGVEMSEAAVNDARMNAALNNVNHAEFFSGDVIKVCNDEFFSEHGRPDVIITDPPRAGMHNDLVKKLLEISAPLIVYVSCNPATQARDLQLLSESYDVTALQPVDMFPHTHHIENIAQLTLKS